MKTLFIIPLLFLSSCANMGAKTTFELSSGSKVILDRQGCLIETGRFMNATSRDVKTVYGSIIGSNANGNMTIDEFMLTCSPAVAGGASACSINKIRGQGGFSDYGGFGCPDMKLKIMNLQVH